MALTVTVDGNDLTDFLQDRSLSAKRNGVDFTLIDASSVPVVNDAVALTDPTWSGAVTDVEIVGYKGDIPFYRVRAGNSDALVDGGAAPFGISDTPDNATTFGFKDLSVQNQLRGTTTETRAKAIVYEPGLEAGMELEVTSAVHGYSAEVFTIMDLTTEYPTEDGPAFTLDLGLGDFATATTGADGGGPLDPIDLGQGIVDVVTDAGCCGDSGGGGGTGGGPGDPDGITDTFTRTEGPSDMGVSDAGITWGIVEVDTVVTSVNGTMLEVELPISNADDPSLTATLDGVWPTTYGAIASVQFRISALPGGQVVLRIGGKLRGLYWLAFIDTRTGVGAPYSTFGFQSSTNTAIPSAYWVAGRTYTVKCVDDGTNMTFTLTDGTTDYVVAKGVAETRTEIEDVVLTITGTTDGITSPQTITVWMDNLDIPEVRLRQIVAVQQTRPVHIEYTTLPALGASPENQTADAYYDYQFNAGTNALMETVGFTTADDITFTATRSGQVSIFGGFDLDPTPTTTDIIVIDVPGFTGLAYKYGVNVSTTITIGRQQWFEVGDFFKLYLYGTITDNPITYGVISIARISG